MKKHIVLPGVILVLILVSIGGCQDSEDPTGRIVLKVTDEPFPVDMITDANVTITKVEVRAAEEETAESESTEEDASGETGFITLWEGSRELELMNLRNGIMEELADVEVPAAEYDLVRVHVVSASISLIDDWGDYTVDVPSGYSSGVKIFIRPGLTVAGGLTTELLLDISVDKSFVLQGDLDSPAGIKGFNFKPVIRAVNNSIAGRIEGLVFELDQEDNQVPLAGVTISLEVDGQELKATSSGDGNYVIPGILAGNYLVTASKEGYPTVEAQVEVVPGNATIKDFVLTANYVSGL